MPVDLFQDSRSFDHRLSLREPLRLSRYRYAAERAVQSVPDTHYALHLGIALRGSMRVWLPGSERTVEAGDVWLTSCWEPHVGVPAGDTEVVLCTVLLEALGSLDPFGRTPWESPFLVAPEQRPQVPASRRRPVLVLARQLVRLADGADDSGGVAAWLTFHQLLLLLVRSWTHGQRREGVPDGGTRPRVQPAIDLVRRRRGEPVRLAEAAAACGLSTSRFGELFRLAMGGTFAQFALRARLAGAAGDIRGTSLPLKAVAEQWGFYDPSHFFRVFRRHFGNGPREFRAAARR